MDTIDKTPQARLLKKGAEASLFLTQWHGRKAVLKVRIPKRYRPAELDQQIRYSRTCREPQLMHEAKAAGVATPLIYMVNVPEATIMMEYVEGEQMKKLLNRAERSLRQALCVEIGESVAYLHQNSLIHGDLTTSNMIKADNGRIVFVDFGLGDRTTEIEAKGVDLHLLKRALQSTHFSFWEECYHHVLKGYSAVSGEVQAEKVYEKTREIEKRGRYVEERRR